MTKSSSRSSLVVTTMTETQQYDFANIVFINVATQAPIHFTAINYFTWKAQRDALLYGYALTGYVDGYLVCPSQSSTQTYVYWTRHDQLLFGSLLVSLSRDLATMVAPTKTLCDLSNKFSIKYASLHGLASSDFEKKLFKPQRSRSFTTYMFDIKGQHMTSFTK